MSRNQFMVASLALALLVRYGVEVELYAQSGTRSYGPSTRPRRAAPGQGSERMQRGRQRQPRGAGTHLSPRFRQYGASQEPRPTGLNPRINDFVPTPNRSTSDRQPPSLNIRNRQDSESTESDLADLSDIDFFAEKESLPVRHWVDNTGTFSARGRLISIWENHVRLFKDNGNTSTVPMRRLSDGDRQYVRKQVALHQAGAD